VDGLGKGVGEIFLIQALLKVCNLNI